jgi:hypothetical protein
MALDPQFAAIPVVGGSAVSATADTSYTAPAHTVTILGGQGPRQVTDGVTNSTTLLTSATALFNSGDIGRPVSGSGIPAGTVVAAFASATNVTMSQPATASASGVTVTLGGGIGTKIEEVVVIGNGSPTLAGVVNTFRYDAPNTTYHFHDSFIVTAVTPSTTTAAFRLVRDYQNLWLPPQWLFVASSWVASQLVNVDASGLNA